MPNDSKDATPTNTTPPTDATADCDRCLAAEKAAADKAAAAEKANQALGPAPRQLDVPQVRADYEFEPGEFAALAPLPGYHGCIALIPLESNALGVALYVSHRTLHGVSWLPPTGTVIVDVPRGFSIDNAGAILDWIQRSPEPGRPPPPGPVVD